MRIVSNAGTDRVVDLIQPWLRPGHRMDLASETLSLILSHLFRSEQFNRWLALDDEERTPSRLVEMLGFDYFTLLDRLTIARRPLNRDVA